MGATALAGAVAAAAAAAVKRRGGTKLAADAGEDDSPEAGAVGAAAAAGGHAAAPGGALTAEEERARGAGSSLCKVPTEPLLLFGGLLRLGLLLCFAEEVFVVLGVFLEALLHCTEALDAVRALVLLLGI